MYSNAKELAVGFVSDYLERSPEYLDVVEYITDNFEDEDAITDSLNDEVYVRVNAILDTVARRYGDADD